MEIEFKNQAFKFLEKIDKETITRIIKRIELLKTYPFSHDTKRVVGHKEKVFRIRIGEYRVLYRANYKDNKIIIVNIDKRSRVY